MPKRIDPTSLALSRRGFTMVEILFVVTIIGIVASLITYAAMQALGRAREARIQVEIDQLAAAAEQFKTAYGEYPPGMGTKDQLNGASGPFEAAPSRRARIQSFISRAFSQSTYTEYWSADMNLQPQTLRYAVGAATVRPTTANPPPDYGVPFGMGVNAPIFSEAGTPNCCDLETLDAAEVLVLWLGGLPRYLPDANNRLIVELTGFANDPTTPFVGQPVGPSIDPTWSAGQSRTKSLFSFDQARLTDFDGDGWPEYIPQVAGVDFSAPYAYFESNTYTFQPCYPDAEQTSTPEPGDPYTLLTPQLIRDAHALLSLSTGVAKPYARTMRRTDAGVDDRAQWNITWVEGQRFQIIAAGRDNQYGLAIPVASTTPNVGWLEYEDREIREILRMFPDDQRWIPASSTPAPSPGHPSNDLLPNHAPNEYDNLTNFTTGRLEADLKPVGVE